MILKILEDIIKEELNKLNYEVDVVVTKSNRLDLCDYQFNGIFKLSSIYHKKPVEIGEEIVDSINDRKDFEHYFKKVEFASPGFINITISDILINECLTRMNCMDKFGVEQDSTLTYVLDYGGPNIAKPLHVGHLRPAIIGESIKRILNFKGCKTIADVHFGDFGLQMGQVIYGIKQKNIKLEDLTLNDLNTIYPEISKLCKEDKDVKNMCATLEKQMQDGDKELEKYYDKIFELSSNDIKEIYKYLDIDFDLWYGEMSSRKYLPFVEEKIKDIAYISDGATVIDVKEENDKKELPPLIFKKSDGAYLYGSTDMATIYEREEDFNPDYILYVADLRQDLHFKQVFRASLKSKITDAKLEHLGFGTINGTDGKPFKTRSGETPKLRDLFNEVKELFISKKEENSSMNEEDIDKIVNAILKFADLQNNREKDYIFDIKKFSEVVGKTGPYVLYTYLRINKIVKDMEITSLNNIVYNEFDRNLRIKLLDLHSIVDNAYKTRMPSFIADYVYDLCMIINSFYQNNHINNLDDIEKKNNWIYVLNLSNRILKEMLNILVIDIPSVM